MFGIVNEQENSIKEFARKHNLSYVQYNPACQPHYKLYAVKMSEAHDVASNIESDFVSVFPKGNISFEIIPDEFGNMAQEFNPRMDGFLANIIFKFS